MKFIYCLTIFMIFPISSWAFSCYYNDSATVLRKTVLFDLGEHNYLHIYDATFDIKRKNNTNKPSPELVNKNLHLIEDILFKGYLAQGDYSEYIEVTLNTLKSYRTKIRNGICRVSFYKTKIEGLDITPEQEMAITRLAESCIQSRVCGFDLMETDRESDLYYQSIQSYLNEAVDFYIPKVLDLFLLNDDKTIKIPTTNFSSGNNYFYFYSAIIEGIDTIQRTNDIVIKHEKSKYNISLVARFEELNISFYGLEAKNGIVGTLKLGDVHVGIQGLSVKTHIIIDLQPQTCKIELGNINTVAFKLLNLTKPIWQKIATAYKLESDKFWFYHRIILNYFIGLIPKYNFDCKQYLDKLSELI